LEYMRGQPVGGFLVYAEKILDGFILKCEAPKWSDFFCIEGLVKKLIQRKQEILQDKFLH